MLLAGLLTLPGAASTQSTEAAPPAQQQTTENVPVSTVGVNLNITPRRLTFDRNTRTATVYVFNQGTAAAAFDVSLIDRVMLPNGEIRAVSEVGEMPEWQPTVARLKSANDLVLAAPRRITLAPGEGQTIRIRASQPDEGGDTGEYRTHLTVSTIPPADVGLTAEEAAAVEANELVFRVQSVFGISIPIIIRPGTVDAQGDIGNVSLGFAELSPDGVAPPVRTPVLGFDILRTGANSLFGNIEIRSAGADNEVIGLARGVGVYPEIDRRSIRIPLLRQPKAGEQLEIVFIDDDSKPGSVIARSSFTAS